MRKFNHLNDLQALSSDPDLKREMLGFMCACREELLEYTDEDDLADYDYNFKLATDHDLDELEALGMPEEIAIIDICCDGKSRKLHRLVFVSEVVFIDASQLPEENQFSGNYELEKTTDIQS